MQSRSRSTSTLIRRVPPGALIGTDALRTELAAAGTDVTCPGWGERSRGIP